LFERGRKLERGLRPLSLTHSLFKLFCPRQAYSGLASPPALSPKVKWFPTFVGMVIGGRATSLERGIRIERGLAPPLADALPDY